MIRVEDLAVTFNKGSALEVAALKGVSLDIASGAFVTVIGSNAAGKSTLLNAIAGETPADRGRVIVEDTDVTAWPAARRASLITRVVQNPANGTCEGLTIAENIALASRRGHRRRPRAAVSRSLRAEIRDRLAALGLGLEARLDDPIDALSGGQRQAVALVMATFRPARLLLLDEHTAALDPANARLILGLTVQTVTTHRLTALMITHSLSQALAVGDRTLMLHDGGIVLDIAGAHRRGLTPEDLMAEFARARGQRLDDDGLLLPG